MPPPSFILPVFPLLFLLLLPVAVSIPAPNTRTNRQQNNSPEPVPIPDVPGAPSDAPGGPPDAQTPTPVPTQSFIPSISPTPSQSTIPFPLASASPEPSDPSLTPDPNNEAGVAGNFDGTNTRAPSGLTGGLIAGGFALFLLLAFLIGLAIARRTESGPPPVYSSSVSAKPPPPPPAGTASGSDAPIPPVVPPPPPSSGDGGSTVYTDKDATRDIAPAVPPVVAAGSFGDDDGGDAAAAVLPRGPTPPPHDYVLGAGPATTRTDFLDLRTKFERDEIGDNSAVLGLYVEKGSSPSLHDSSTTGLPPPPVAVGVGGVVPPPVTAERKAEREGADAEEDSGLLPDRSAVAGAGAGITFDSQERLMAGGDGSGAISDAAMSFTAASIQEESGDVPSLERDTIAMRRDRDDTF